LTGEDTRENYGEPRFLTMGMIDGAPHVVVHTPRDETRGSSAFARPTVAKGSSMAKRPNPELTDSDNPEWTAADFTGAQPTRAFYKQRGLRYPGERGPQKAPTKQQVTLRLDQDLVAHLKATGAGWQTRVNQSLRASMMSKPAVKRSAIKTSGKGRRKVG
jgi:uncharacterized protein (DUF4415 family)